MQFNKKNTSKKIIAMALATFMFASFMGNSIVMADENVENITISEETIDKAISTSDVDKLISEESSEVQSESTDVIEENTDDLEDFEVGSNEKSIKTATTSLNGFVRIDGKWYYYVNNVQMKGWVNHNGITYYIINTYALPQNMWRTIKGKRYYFNKDGIIVRDQKIMIDGKEYQFNKEGHMVSLDNSKKLGEVTPAQQAIYNAGERTLIDSVNNGKDFVKNGLFREGGKWYKYVNGSKTRGWYQEGNRRSYFLNTLNRAENMWRKINDVVYYFDSNGTMVSNTIKYIDGKTYKFNANGGLVTSAKTSVLNTNVSVRTSANNSSSVVGNLQKGNGIEIISVSGSYANIKSGNGAIQGWIPVSAYVSESQKKINDVIAVAKSKLGSTYVWGATGPNSFDCSGLMLYSFRHGANVRLPRVSRQQATAGRYVSRDELRPGDMVFWGSPVHHVGLYIGDGKYIHAPEPGTSVRIATLGAYTTARRVIE